MLGHDPVWFVLLSGFVFFAWGEIYSLFPSTCTDTFGSKFATTNAGLLYTAKGTAALLVPVANYMQQSSGTWDNVFIVAAGANILASLLAIAVLKPWRKAVVAQVAGRRPDRNAPSARNSALILRDGRVFFGAMRISGIPERDLERCCGNRPFGQPTARVQMPKMSAITACLSAVQTRQFPLSIALTIGIMYTRI